MDKRPYSVTETLLAIIFLTATIVLEAHAISLVFKGQKFPALEYAGMGMIFFSGCFDPINTIWAMLPFTSLKDVRESRWPKASAIAVGIGTPAFFIGWIFKHWLS
ncbi:MAG: hypothetical protein ACREUV_07655 [Burkholderiales bacterium]